MKVLAFLSLFSVSLKALADPLCLLTIGRKGENKQVVRLTLKSSSAREQFFQSKFEDLEASGFIIWDSPNAAPRFHVRAYDSHVGVYTEASARSLFLQTSGYAATIECALKNKEM
jgi:hypothetical protein